MMLHPEAAATVDEFIKKYLAWNATYQIRINRVGRVKAVIGPDLEQS